MAKTKPIRYLSRCQRRRTRARLARINALIAADEQAHLPLPFTIDPPGATDEEVRRNFAALSGFTSIDLEVRAILTAHYHRRMEKNTNG